MARISAQDITGTDGSILSDNERQSGAALSTNFRERALAPMRIESFKRAQALYNRVAKEPSDPLFAGLPVFVQSYTEDFMTWYFGTNPKNAQTRHVDARTPILEAIIERANRRIPAMESNIAGIEARIGTTNEEDDDVDALAALNADLEEAQKDKADAETELATFA